MIMKKNLTPEIYSLVRRGTANWLVCFFLMSLKFLLSSQRPNSAKIMSLSAPVVSVYPPVSFVMGTTIVRMARMKPLVPNPPAALAPSSATTQGVSRPRGAVTEIQTVLTALTSGRRTVMGGHLCTRPAVCMSSSAWVGSVSTAAGGVMEASTAWIDRTKSTVVSVVNDLAFMFLLQFLLLKTHKGQHKFTRSKTLLQALKQLYNWRNTFRGPETNSQSLNCDKWRMYLIRRSGYWRVVSLCWQKMLRKEIAALHFLRFVER